MSERSCENCKHNLAVFYDPCPECIPEKRSQWEAMPPAAITGYPHQCDWLREQGWTIVKNTNGEVWMWVNRHPLFIPHCPGCGGRCL